MQRIKTKLFLANVQKLTDKNYDNMIATEFYLFLQEPPFVFKSKQIPNWKEKFGDVGTEHKYYYDSNSSTYYFGYCIDLLYHINDSLNFDFVLTEPPDGKYGSMQANGSWDGMINELYNDVTKLLYRIYCSISNFD